MSALTHLGIIMDGNRRWAKESNLNSYEGHKKGYEKLKEVGQWCIDKGITTLTVYAFSTENWNRSKEEVGYLMKLLSKVFTEEVEEFNKRGIRIKVIGSKEKLSEKIKKEITNVEEKTKENKKGTLNLCFNYGGRVEIVEAVKKIVKEGLSPDEIGEDTITKYTWMGEQKDPDLILRTSGEQRLSGFLTWQSVYSEFYFTKCHWPAFSEEDLDKTIEEFNHRNRRFGGN